MKKRSKVGLKSVLSSISFIVGIYLGLTSDTESQSFIIFVILGIAVVIGIEVVDHITDSIIIPENWKLDSVNLLLDSARRILFGAKIPYTESQ